MRLKVKPVFVVGPGPAIFCQPDGALQVISDVEVIKSRVDGLVQQFKDRLESNTALVEPALVRQDADFVKLGKDALEVDAFLVYLLGHMPLERLFDLGIPLIVFGGEHTPMQALYAFPIEERDRRTNVTLALDFKDIEDQIRLLGVMKRLKNTTIALIGFPWPTYSNWQHFPDPEAMRRRLGVNITPVESRRYFEALSSIEEAKAEAVAQEWMAKAQEVVEPSSVEVTEAARVYLAIDKVLKEATAQAAAFNCVELVFVRGSTPPCFALPMLRDEGVPVACEADVGALLTMLILGCMAEKPAFMGNIVGAVPEDNLVKVSHCAMPTKMAGFAQPPRPYRLRNFAHGEGGVTAYVDLDKGQEVTLARIARNLDGMLALRGEIVDCRDTATCRNTVTLRVNDAREFFHQAAGNHHVLVYGNYIRELRGLSRALGINLVEV